MHGFKGERVLMRIHIGERDKFEGKALYALPLAHVRIPPCEVPVFAPETNARPDHLVERDCA